MHSLTEVPGSTFFDSESESKISWTSSPVPIQSLKYPVNRFRLKDIPNIYSGPESVSRTTTESLGISIPIPSQIFPHKWNFYRLCTILYKRWFERKRGVDFEKKNVPSLNLSSKIPGLWLSDFSGLNFDTKSGSETRLKPRVSVFRFRDERNRESLLLKLPFLSDKYT